MTIFLSIITRVKYKIVAVVTIIILNCEAFVLCMVFCISRTHTEFMVQFGSLCSVRNIVQWYWFFAAFMSWGFPVKQRGSLHCVIIVEIQHFCVILVFNRTACKKFVWYISSIFGHFCFCFICASDISRNCADLIALHCKNDDWRKTPHKLIRW